MGNVDRGDDVTFRVNFTGDGAAKLKERVMEKLKEYMGEYTDETLVEYVIVLLRNGRRKEEARNELNVFLGDDSHSFISWLWDHLSSYLDTYVQPQESYMDEAAKEDPTSGVQPAKNENHHLDSESERGNSNKLSRHRHRREWKGLVRDAAEPPPLRSSEFDFDLGEKTYPKFRSEKRSTSLRAPVQRKRSRPDERQHAKRDTISQANVDAPRRLLQFAVRDAVATLKPSNLGTEPKLKRLRSVVSTSTGDSSLVDQPRRIQSVARVANPMATVIKAVAEAAEDVKKVKSSGSVFDRLSRGMGALETGAQHAEFSEAAEDDDYADFNEIQEQTRLKYFQRSDYVERYAGKITMLESETGMASDSTSDNEGYDDVNVMGHSVMGHSVMDVSQSATSGVKKGEDSLMVQYSVAKNADEVGRITRNKEEELPAAAANTSRKIVNISVNVNTWKPPHYKEPREIAELENRKSVLESEAGTGISGVRLMRENDNPVTVGHGQETRAANTQIEAQKTLSSALGLYSAGRPSEDTDSRTIFVSNVHFAATKDILSRHFNKFGEVLKVVIVTDAATGQPKGSAYVEFMRKEAADSALTLDGTSFMSRILKVVRRSPSHQEAAPTITWPRIARGSTFSAARFARVPFPRGIPGAFRPRLPFKPGARSFQWKRDSQATPAEGGTPVSGNNIASPAARSLTYVRMEPKPVGNSGST